MLKTSGNAPTLLLIGSLSNIFVTATPIWFLHPKPVFCQLSLFIFWWSQISMADWQTTNKLLHHKSSSPLSTSTSASALTDSLASFSTDSAAFDTIDHNIFLTRLSSWFGIHGTTLNWFRSFLSSRCFRVKCINNLSFLNTCLCGVPPRLSSWPSTLFL